jgi:Putative porin
MRQPDTLTPNPYTDTSLSTTRRFSPKALAAALAFLTTLFCGLSNAFAADPSDPVLNLLLQKGIISQQELDKAKAEAEAIRTNNAALPPMESKWRINNAFKSVELFGDLRLRYENRQVHDPGDGRIELNRERIAVRLGLRGEVLDDFYYGVRLDTANNPRSPWVSLGTSSSGAPYQGPFGKSTFNINVGQLYLGWKPTSWLDITAGKMPNPFYFTPMTWDTDLNPEGLAERFKYSIGQADLFLNLGQFIYQDTNPTHASSGYFNLGFDSSSPAFLLAWQAGLNYHITKDLSVKVAPILYNYTGHGVNSSPSSGTPDFRGTFIGQGTTNGVGGTPGVFYSGFPTGPYDGFVDNQTGINDLLVLDIPFELNYNFACFSARLFGDYAQNLQGSERAKAAFRAQDSPLLAGSGLIRIPSAQTGDTKAYQVGIAIGSTNSLGLVYGSTVRKHAWEARTYWQHIEQYALDPNLLDSDFFEGRGNLEGIYASVAYGFSENVIGTFRYGYAQRINDKLGTGGSNQDIPQMNPISHYNIFQIDLSLRF